MIPRRRGPPDPRVLRAKERLDLLALYPRPVDVDRVRVLVAPWLFRLPGFRRFDGYALPQTILLRRDDVSDDLVVHELCHVWQLQHRPLRQPLSYLRHGYARNPYEVEARAAAAARHEEKPAGGQTEVSPPRE